MQGNTTDENVRGSTDGPSATESIRGEGQQLADEARESVRQVADEARGQVERAASGLIESVAGQLERFAQDMREESLESLLDRGQALARSNPELLFAGSVAAGLALARFAKSSASRRIADEGRPPSLASSGPRGSLPETIGAQPRTSNVTGPRASSVIVSPDEVR